MSTTNIWPGRNPYDDRTVPRGRREWLAWWCHPEDFSTSHRTEDGNSTLCGMVIPQGWEEGDQSAETCVECSDIAKARFLDYEVGKQPRSPCGQCGAPLTMGLWANVTDARTNVSATGPVYCSADWSHDWRPSIHAEAILRRLFPEILRTGTLPNSGTPVVYGEYHSEELTADEYTYLTNLLGDET